VSDDASNRIGGPKRRNQFRADSVLDLLVGEIIRTLELYSDGEIVAAATPAPRRNASVPSAPEAGDKLKERSISSDEEMGRDANIPQLVEVRVGIVVQGVGE